MIEAIPYTIFHLICGILGAGILCADLQTKYWVLKEYRKDLMFSLCTGLAFGPIALVLAYFFTGFAKHGCSLRKNNKQGSQGNDVG